MVLPPHRKKLLRAWCPVLLGLFLTGFTLPWTRFWVLGLLRTRLKMIRLSAQMGPLPCRRGLPRTTSPVLLGHLLWESRLPWTNCGVAGPLRTGLPQLHLSACWWGRISQVTQLGRHLTLARLRGVRTPWVLSHPRPRQTSAQLWMTALMSWPRLDSVTWDRNMPPVKAAGAVTSGGPAGSCQTARSHESRSTSTQPGGSKVSTAICNKHRGCLQYPIIMTWHLPRTFALEMFQ